MGEVIPEIILTLSLPLLNFEPPENIRKPLVFSCFQGKQKGALGRQGLKRMNVISLKGKNVLQRQTTNLEDPQPGIYLFKVNNGNTRTMREICLKLTIKTPERRQLTSLFWFFHYCFEQVNADWVQMPGKSVQMTTNKAYI